MRFTCSLTLLAVLAWLACGCSSDRVSGAAHARPASPEQPSSTSVAPGDPVASTAGAEPTSIGGSPGTAIRARAAAPGTSDPSLETVLAPVRDVEVFARLEGLVVAIDVEEGRRVAAGTQLARLDDRERRAALQEAEAQVARTAAAWERAQRLWEQKVIAEVQHIEARSEWMVASARRDRARLELEHCTVRAPIAGAVALRRAQRGQMVRSGDLLFRVSDPDLLRAELLLPESRLGTVRPGQEVRLVPVAGGAPQVARITRVSPMVDPASGTFRVTIDLDNRRARLPSGISARVALEPAALR